MIVLLYAYFETRSEKSALIIMSRRRKNPHPKRAVNARTVLKAEKEEPVVLCSRIPDEEDDLEANHLQIQKEKTTVKKGTKRKRTQHECDVCEKVFTQSGDLKVHMRVHTNERPYECDVCEKRFTQSGSLARHMRTHTNEKPYECDVCEKCFRHSSALRVHKRTHR